MAERKTLLAIYDLDKTITRIPTYTPFLLSTALRQKPWRLLLVPLVLLAMAIYPLRLINRAQLKQIMWALLLGKLSPEHMRRAVDEFVQRTHLKNLCPGALAQIEADRAEGARLVLATASYSAYAGPIAQALGFTDIIGTGLKVDGKGRYGPRLIAPNCYGAEKLQLVEAWFARSGLSRAAVHARFYSDSSTDRPMFDWADEPVVVNPSRKLAKLARARGWPIHDWR
jgi:HAD superfamily hydrolase (TIGR01490 family)